MLANWEFAESLFDVYIPQVRYHLSRAFVR